MSTLRKSASAWIVATFILTAITHANAQTDTIGRNKSVVIERGTVYPQNSDSLPNNMLTPGIKDSNLLNKNTTPDSIYKNKSNGDSSHMGHAQPVIKDTIHPATPMPPDKTKSVVKPSAPPKNTINPAELKTTKNKIMYLVPDSMLRKDSLK